jgi:cytochrome P450 family 142 subfamily A polypeptide 1
VEVDVSYLEAASWQPDAMAARMKWLRENDPVRWSEKDGLWLVAKFAHVAFVSRHQELFTSEHGVRPANPTRIGLIDEPEPRHGQLRGLLNKGFTPRMVGKLEETFRALVTEHVDAIAGLGACDFVHAIAVPLPLELIAAMIGIRREDYDRFHQWSDAMIAADGNLDRPEIVARAIQAFTEYATYVSEIIEDRRRNPQDDLVTVLTGAKDRGLLRQFDDREHLQRFGEQDWGLANDELIKLLVILLVAGNETTRNAISGGMQLLIEHPDERRKLAENPALIAGAVEEMLRLVSPVHSFSRTAVQDTELGGKPIRRGERVLLLYPSANRDADVFPDPDAFRVERNPQHLAFGVGTHFCLGANLARMEMRAVFDELLRRLPDMEYADGGPLLQPSALVRTCTRMNVRFTPERAPAAARTS